MQRDISFPAAQRKIVVICEIDTVSGEKTTSYTDDTVKAGKTYYYKVEAYNVNSGTKGYGGASDAVAGKTAKRTKITSIVSTNEKTLTIKWNKITGAYGYRIKRSTDEEWYLQSC